METTGRLDSGPQMEQDVTMPFPLSYDSGNPLKADADALILPIRTDASGNLIFAGPTAEANSSLKGELRQLAADARFTGKPGSCLVIPTVGRLKARRVVLTGVGSADSIDAESLRKAWGSAVTAARDAGATRIVSALPEGSTATTLEGAVQGALLGSYRFATYHGTVKNEKPATEIESLSFVDRQLEKDEVESALARGNALADAVNFARSLTHEPGGVLSPVRVGEIAKEVAKKAGLACEVFGPKELAKMGAEAILTVGKGSSNPPCMIHLTFKPKGSKKGIRSIGLVGKCITFDTGGYSIKPADAMLDMKGDMAGGAAVLATMTALKALGCPYEVHGVICAAENMISGEAFRPDDIIVGMNGVTMEILSTDAEGRLVLADGLVYTSRLGVGEMIDLATLTGAKVVALGEETTALYANRDDLADNLLASAKRSGELMWRMPLTEALERQIKGELADIKNTGGRAGGSITAALFLQHFSEGLPWAHLDIAGANRTKTGSSYTPKGTTGVGVRTLLDYLTEGVNA
jgi:leucyl aminopeptidase